MAVPPAMNEGSFCFTSLTASGVVSVLDFCHSSRCVVVSSFNLHFPDDICGVSFHMLICYLYIFFSEVSVEVFGPFFNWAVCFLIAEL